MNTEATTTIDHAEAIPADPQDESGRPLWVDRQSWHELQRCHHRLRKIVTLLMRECIWGEHKLAVCQGISPIRGREICCEPEDEAARGAHSRGIAVDLAVFAGWHAMVGPSGPQIEQIAGAIGTWAFELNIPVRWQPCGPSGPFHLELCGLPSVDL